MPRPGEASAYRERVRGAAVHPVDLSVLSWYLTHIDDLENRLRNAADANPCLDLLFGMFVEAEIQGRLARNVVSLPCTALRAGDQVLVVDEESRLRFRAVEILRAERDRVIVRSGLRDGERVCVSIVETAVEGMKVRTVEQESTPDVG